MRLEGKEVMIKTMQTAVIIGTRVVSLDLLPFVDVLCWDLTRKALCDRTLLMIEMLRAVIMEKGMIL